jgi:hypothetical protein
MELERLADDVRSIKASLASQQNNLDKVSDALERLVRLEERSSTTREAQALQWKRLDDLTNRLAEVEKNALIAHEVAAIPKIQIDNIASRLTEIEKSEPLQTQASKWVMGAMWAAAGVAVAFVAKSVGLL